jgi:hypothetical protein
MHKVSVAILYCAEYNFEKLKTHWREPKSPEEALCWKLECGITKCIHILLISETYHWNKIDRRCRNIPDSKNTPLKLRKILVKLMNNSASAKTENGRIVKLRVGIRSVVIYLRKIKENENYLNSIALQDVHKYLRNLLELKISQ